MTLKVELTEAHRQAVREEECSTVGHDFAIVEIEQTHDPQAIVCSRCGKTWKVKS